MKEDEGNTKITVQDWLDYLKSEKEINYNNLGQTITPRMIGVSTLLIASFITFVQAFPLNFLVMGLGGAGIIISCIIIYYIIKQTKYHYETILFIEKIQLKILRGELQEVKQIAVEYKEVPHVLGGENGYSYIYNSKMIEKSSH